MFKLKLRMMAAAALSAALLGGCSDGGGGGGENAAALPPAEQTITAVVDFIKSLIAGNGENSEPIDINPLTLAADATSEPQALD
jgi:hypothetical protein